MRKVPGQEINVRIDNFKKYLEKEKIDFAIITQNVDRFYFTGTMQNGVLVVPQDHDPVLFVIRTYSTALEESSINDIRPYSGTKDIVNFIRDKKVKASTIGIEMDVTPASLYERFKGLFDRAEIRDVSPGVKRLRMIKSNYELELMREAALRHDRVMENISSIIKPGVTEFELLAEYTKLIVQEESSPCIRTRQYNMEATQRYILSGNSVSRQSYMDSPSAGGYGVTIAFPGGAGYKKIEKGEPILIDLVINYEGYNVDCTRIFSIGELDKKLVDAHNISKKAHEIFVDMAKRGSSTKEIYREVIKLINESEYSEYFMGGVKFIGHGIGLELDEVPVITERYDEPVSAGMTIAFEPKFIFEDGAAGYETTYAVTEDGVEALNRFPSDIVYL